MSDEVAGDPVTGMKWTRKTTERISIELSLIGINVKSKTVGRLLKKMKFSLKTNRKNMLSGGKRKPDYRQQRDSQFLNMAEVKAKHKNLSIPIISVDTKKKEELGNFKNKGKVWTREAKEVHDHDYKSDSIGKAVPYGIFDVKRNQAYVVVGQSKDTAAFATDAIERWWKVDGRKNYPKTEKILILADCGGSNGSRSRVWKRDLQLKICNKYRISVTVCHYPPGSSKWNPIEHRLFSQISNNWSGVPLLDYETVLNYIRTTTTSKGLIVKAIRNKRIYNTGEKVSKKEFKAINCQHAEKLPVWNYTINPQV